MTVCLILLAIITCFLLQIILCTKSKVQAQSTNMESMRYACAQHPLKCSHSSSHSHALHYQHSLCRRYQCLVINQKWFWRVRAYLQLQQVTYRLHGYGSDSIQLFLQQNNEVYVTNSHLISNTCIVISTSQNFCVTIFSWGTLEDLFTQIFNT